MDDLAPEDVAVGVGRFVHRPYRVVRIHPGGVFVPIIAWSHGEQMAQQDLVPLGLLRIIVFREERQTGISVPAMSFRSSAMPNSSETTLFEMDHTLCLVTASCGTRPMGPAQFSSSPAA